jgi:hypothetical protein
MEDCIDSPKPETVILATGDERRDQVLVTLATWPSAQESATDVPQEEEVNGRPESVDLHGKSVKIEAEPARGSTRVLATRPTRCPPHQASREIERRLVMTGQKIAAGGQSIGR